MFSNFEMDTFATVFICSSEASCIFLIDIDSSPFCASPEGHVVHALVPHLLH
jgi:Na+-transporting NADH:ubiquinone oxidoreductase subunit NqrA